MVNYSRAIRAVPARQLAAVEKLDRRVFGDLPTISHGRAVN
jgi:hypothetical protein